MIDKNGDGVISQEDFDDIPKFIYYSTITINKKTAEELIAFMDETIVVCHITAVFSKKSKKFKESKKGISHEPLFRLKLDKLDTTTHWNIERSIKQNNNLSRCQSWNSLEAQFPRKPRMAGTHWRTQMTKHVKMLHHSQLHLK